MSRRWAEVLTSPAVLQASIQPRSQSDTETLPDNAAKAQSFSLTAESIDAWQRGVPFSIAIKNTASVFVQFSCYKDGILAWVKDDEPSTVTFCDLKDGEDYTVTLPNREVIGRIAVSSTLLAAATRIGKVYLWTIPLMPGRSPRVIRLESAQVPLLDLAHRTLACFRRDPGVGHGPRETNETITVYSEHEDIVRSWTRKYRFQCCRSFTSFLSADGLYVCYMGEVDGTVYHDKHCLTRCDLKGKVVAVIYFECLTSAYHSTGTLLRPAGRPAEYMRRLYFSEDIDHTAPETKRSESSELYTWQVRHLSVYATSNIIETGLARFEMDVEDDTDIRDAFVSSLAFYFVLDVGIGRMYTVNLETGECGSAVSDFLERAGASHVNLDQLGESFFTGDGKFLIASLGDRALIMSFDKTVSLPNEITDWKIERRRLFEEAVKLRRKEQERASKKVR